MMMFGGLVLLLLCLEKVRDIDYDSVVWLSERKRILRF
jgi:hypothetical protein